MSKQDSDRWNARYAAGAYGARNHPSDLLRQWLPAIKKTTLTRGTERVAWDIACGSGRNTLHLAQQGFAVLGVDVAAAGLAQAAARLREARLGQPELDLDVQFLEQDLELNSSAQTLFSVAPPPSLVVVFRYLNLPLLPLLLQRLTPGGWLMVEVHLQRSAAAARPADTIGGPSSNRFRAAPGALTSALADAAAELPNYEPVFANEGLVTDPDGKQMALAQLLVQRTNVG